VVSQQQRQRDLAYAKRERQQAQRAADAARRRRISIVVGVIAGLLGIAALVWLVLSQADDDEAPGPLPTAPVDTVLPSQFNPLPTDQLAPPRETQPVEGPESGGQEPEVSPSAPPTEQPDEQPTSSQGKS